MTTKVNPSLISVPGVCHLLDFTGLILPAEVQRLVNRWSMEAGPAAGDVLRFREWLVFNQYVTEYQADRLLRGHTDYYFLNQYKLLDRIGRGRMAGVYKAVHQVGQLVAIKVLPPSKARDANVFARFRREARLARQLKHANVVRTFQISECNGLHFLVMEHLEGETLLEVLERRRQLPVREAVRLMHQALQGLQHIHEEGLVHRDLEPGNLMLVPARQPGEDDTTLASTVKILDIGLGRQTFADGETESGTQLTAADAILGTPHYMAPEQARDSHKADIRADLYSLGCVFYHALAGQPPFPEKLAMRAMIRHATEVPAPLRQFNPDVPDRLQLIVDSLLAKDPAKRYATPHEAAQALRRFIGSTQLVQPAVETSASQAYLQWVADNPDPDAEEVSSTPPPKRTPAAKAKPQPAKAKTAPARTKPQAVAAPAESLSGEKEERGPGLTKGDWLFLAAGAAFLFTIVLVAWLFITLQ